MKLGRTAISSRRLLWRILVVESPIVINICDSNNSLYNYYKRFETILYLCTPFSWSSLIKQIYLYTQIGFQAIIEALGMATVKAVVAISAMIDGWRLKTRMQKYFLQIPSLSFLEQVALLQRLSYICAHHSPGPHTSSRNSFPGSNNCYKSYSWSFCLQTVGVILKYMGCFGMLLIAGLPFSAISPRV